jgi:hypothetical protein
MGDVCYVFQITRITENLFTSINLSEIYRQICSGYQHQAPRLEFWSCYIRISVGSSVIMTVVSLGFPHLLQVNIAGSTSGRPR